MRVWIRQKHNSLLDSFRVGFLRVEGKRMIIRCPDTMNVLINCTKPFLDKEIEKKRIIVGGEYERTVIRTGEDPAAYPAGYHEGRT